MKKLHGYSWAAVGAAVLLMVASVPVFAACTDISVPVQHGLGLFFAGCSDAEAVDGIAYALASPGTINTGGLDLSCEDGTEESGTAGTCQPEAGVRGDGNVTVQFNWIDPRAAGCPNPTLTDASGRIVVQVIDNRGASVLANVNFSGAFSAYLMEAAHPATFEPLSCSFGNLPASSVTTAGGSVCFNTPTPKAYSDCDPDSVGVAGGLGTCGVGESAPTLAPGRAFTRQARCGSSPDGRLTGWTSLGPATGCYDVPRPTTADSCAFVGVSSQIGTVESLAVTGSLQLPGALAANPIALDVRARQQGGKVYVSFRTETELGLVGFNVYTRTNKGLVQVNDGMIAAKGLLGAGDSYDVSIDRGKFTSGRIAVVESVLSTGAKLTSADSNSF